MGQSYTIGGDTLEDIGHQYYAAQSFTPQITHTLNCIDINLRTIDATRAPTLWVYLADAEHKPTGDYLSKSIRSFADDWNIYNVFRMRAIMEPTLLSEDVEYVIVIHAFAIAQAYHMQWQYDNNDATYTRGIRLISNDEGETWDPHPGDDHIFAEFGTAPIPEPPPDPPTTKWFIVTIEQTLTATGYIIVVTTNVPCHLWMRWTTIEPKEHLIQRTKRGLAHLVDKYYCFDVYEDNEQEEAGDTLIHTFIKEPWPFCETRYFYFQGEIAGVASKSTTTIFKKHRVQPAEEVFEFYTDIEHSGFWQSRCNSAGVCTNAWPTIYYYIGEAHAPVCGLRYIPYTQRTNRGTMPFDTSTLPPGRSILSAKFIVVIFPPYDEIPFDICAVEGDYSIPPGAREWCNLCDKDTIFASIPSVDVNWPTEIEMPISPAGLAQINPGGWTKFAWRTSHDIEEYLNPTKKQLFATFDQTQCRLIVTLGS